MSQAAVVYWSGTGHTEAMAPGRENLVLTRQNITIDGAQVVHSPAEAVAAAAQADLFTAAEFDADKAAHYAAIAFGCPSMGAEQLEESEFEPMFVMGRAALNFIDLCGVHRAFFDAECENETLIRAIGFAKNPAGRWEMDLTDFFKEPCKHGKGM